MARFVEKAYKSLLNKRKFIDPWFWDRYGINPYNGCQFGCIYCDARSARYHMPEDFEQEIIAKSGVRTLLDQRIGRARTLLPDVVALSGVTDPYQPAEKKFENTRQVLEVLRNHRYPVHIITKSTLVLRDADLLQEIAAGSWCTVSFSITSTDAKTSRFLEGLSPTPEKRLAAMRELKEKAPGVQTGVLSIPVVPGLTDATAAMGALVTASKAAGADYFLFGGGMTMRDMQADWFLSKLRQQHPELIPRYEALYNFKDQGHPFAGEYAPQKDYVQQVELAYFHLCQAAGLPVRIPRWLPTDYRKTNYKVAETLLNQAYTARILGQEAEQMYWAGMNIQNLDMSLKELQQRGELAKIRNVQGAVLDLVLDLMC